MGDAQDEHDGDAQCDDLLAVSGRHGEHDRSGLVVTMTRCGAGSWSSCRRALGRVVPEPTDVDQFRSGARRRPRATTAASRVGPPQHGVLGWQQQHVGDPDSSRQRRLGRIVGHGPLTAVCVK